MQDKLALSVPLVLSSWEKPKPSAIFFKSAPYSSLFASHLFFLNLLVFSEPLRERECSNTRSPQLWIPMTDPCVFKATLVLSSLQILSPDSGGLWNSMNDSLMLLLSLEGQIVFILSHAFFPILFSFYIIVFNNFSLY